MQSTECAMCRRYVVDRVRQGGRRWLCLWWELDKKGLPWCANVQLAYARMPELWDQGETACGERMSCQLVRRAGKVTSGGVIAHLLQCNIGT